MPAESQAGESTILRLDSPTPWTYHILRRVTHESSLSYTVYDGKQGKGITSQPVAEGWHHVAATHDASKGQLELFVDGRSQGTAPYLKTACRNVLLNIGGLVQMQVGSSKVSNPFRGKIDEVRVSRVVRQFQATAAPPGPYVPDDQTGLLLHFDEGAGHLRMRRARRSSPTFPVCSRPSRRCTPSTTSWSGMAMCGGTAPVKSPLSAPGDRLWRCRRAKSGGGRRCPSAPSPVHSCSSRRPISRFR